MARVSGGSSVLRSAHGAGAWAGLCPLLQGWLWWGGGRISQGFLLVRIRASPCPPDSSTHGKHWCTYGLSLLGGFFGMVLAPLETAMTESQPSGICVSLLKCTNPWLGYQAVTFSHLYPVTCLSPVCHCCSTRHRSISLSLTTQDKHCVHSIIFIALFSSVSSLSMYLL